MKISDLSSTSLNFLTDFCISAMLGTSLIDDDLTDEEIDMFWSIIDNIRDWIDLDHPAVPVANNLRRRVNSDENFISNLASAHSMTDRLSPILDSLEDEEANKYAWWVMVCCNMIAIQDGKRDLQESVYIIDLFRNLGWDYSTALEDLRDTNE